MASSPEDRSRRRFMDATTEAGSWNLTSLERTAERVVGPDVWAYIQGGAGEERTIANNRAAFRRRTLLPRALGGPETVDLTTQLLGRRVSAPFFVAPMAYQREVHPDGEGAVARATGAREVLAVYSTLTSCSLEEISASAPEGPRWFQLYPQANPDVSRELVRRAERAGYSAVVVTVDVPVLGSRDRQAETGFAYERPVSIGNGPGVEHPPRRLVPNGARLRLPAPGRVTGESLDEIRRASRLPVIVKGLLDPDDARVAVDHGAAGVVVSNHGGRQLDGAPASLDQLARVVGAVGGRAEVYLDGGVRRGSDIAIALALGATGVGIGRPILWALAAGGEAGVGRYLDLLRDETANVLSQLGRGGVRELGAALVGGGPPSDGR